MIAYIDAHRVEYGVESICGASQFAPRTYYASKARPVSKPEVRGKALKSEIARVHAENFGVYGAVKVWAQLNREGIDVARCTVDRLMGKLALRGVVRGKPVRTTFTDDTIDRPRDLVDRQFTASSPNRLWVVDLTYIKTWSGFVYVAFITDVFSRRIVGWQTSRSLKTDLALDALEQAIWSRQRHSNDLDQLIHHSKRLAENGVINSVGSRGDSYDNALAETINDLYKTELVGHKGPWRGLDDHELATLEWVHRFNRQRIFHKLGRIPPAKFEDLYYRQTNPAKKAAPLTHEYA